MNEFGGILCAAIAWLVWLWYTQPKWENGEYVSIGTRIRKVFKRVFKG